MKVDIPFAHVKHAFFQPCAQDELVAIIHFTLKTPLTLSNKKVDEVQVNIAPDVVTSLSETAKAQGAALVLGRAAPRENSRLIRLGTIARRALRLRLGARPKTKTRRGPSRRARVLR